MSRPTTAPPAAPDVRERGGVRDGQPQFSTRRLWMQLVVLQPGRALDTLIHAMQQTKVEGAIYADLHHACGWGLLAMHEQTEFFTGAWREMLSNLMTDSMMPVRLNPKLTMFGRTYSLGYEPDLEDTLFARPRRTVMDAQSRWAVWYPLRRRGEFALLPESEQRAMLMEHGTIGHSFGAADLGHDVRLACHGLDVHDNDFVIGLMGKHLHPLSVLVQTMRKTQQTGRYIERLGPFFVGRAMWNSALGKLPE